MEGVMKNRFKIVGIIISVAALLVSCGSGKTDSYSPTVTTFAGTAGSYGSTDGTGTDALFNSPSSITTDGTSLYVADTGNNTIRKIVISTKKVSLFAGSTNGDSGSTDGTGTTARFNNPYGITTDGTSLYVADYGNHTIRKIVLATRMVSTLAGKTGSYGATDGTGTDARFNNPLGITMDENNLYVADTGNNTIRKMHWD
jgi:sugar lactone lactonase YvrE